MSAASANRWGRMTPLLTAAVALWLSAAPATSSAAATEAEFPKLWNSVEIKRTKITRFKKWTRVLRQFQDEKASHNVPCPPDPYVSCGVYYWNKFIGGLKNQKRDKQLEAINDYVNKARYVRDWINWGVRDYWETPGEFFQKQGDCEDYAIVKYMTLRALGLKPAQMRIVVLWDMNLKLGHAGLVVYAGRRILLLDNQINRVVDANRISHYRINYSLNENNWWVHISL